VPAALLSGAVQPAQPAGPAMLPLPDTSTLN